MNFADSVSKTVKCCLYKVNFFFVFPNHMFEGQLSYKDNKFNV